MKQVISDTKVPIKLWLDDAEEGAIQQARNLANLPFTFRHVAIMPDTHQGYGMPIGSILATEKVIIPNAVGVDIGCGMCAVKTSLTELSVQERKRIMQFIRDAVPVGFKHHKTKQIEMNRFLESTEQDYNPFTSTDVVKAQLDSAAYQIGTLGGGNHFIELQQGSDGYVWIMIHSGSRALGYQTANYYNKLAIELNEKYFTRVRREWDLAFLPLDSKEGQDYLRDMQVCIAFAYHNRRLMLDRVQDAFLMSQGHVTFEEEINLPHNYATMENHFGKNVMIHRKGATSAKKGELGIIPGSQGTKSYIVVGKGEKQSFMSCSHGAGRKMSRSQARKDLVVADEIKQLEELGVVHAVRGVNDLDEAPSAYKDIDVVIESQKDLIDVMVELKPLAVIKASEGGVD